jgi:hypothetical protein
MSRHRAMPPAKSLQAFAAISSLTRREANLKFARAITISARARRLLIQLRRFAMKRFKVFSVLLLVSGQLTVSHALDELQKVIPDTPVPLDHFGEAVAIDGGTAVVGASGDKNAGNFAGAVYIFERVGGTWTKTQKLIGSDTDASDRFGESVAISGDRMIVGAGNRRVAYIFVRQNGVWTELQKLTADDSPGGFGNSVAIFGSTALVGAPFDDEPEMDAGSAYVFVQEGGLTGSWTQHQKLTASDAAADSAFGRSVSLSNGLAIIGAPDATSLGFVQAGTAYIFAETGGIWSEETKLIPTDLAAFGGFGFSVAMDGSWAIVGTSALSVKHKAYIFIRLFAIGIGPVWLLQANLTGSESPGTPGFLYGFGHSVAISGSRAVVGAPLEDGTGTKAHLFKRIHLHWYKENELSASDQGLYDEFGESVGISQGRIIVGAPHGDINNPPGSGKAYLYDFGFVAAQAQPNPAFVEQSFAYGMIYENGGNRLKATVGVFALTDDGSAVLLERKQIVFKRDGETQEVLYATRHFPKGLSPGLAFLTLIFDREDGDRMGMEILAVGVEEKLTEDQEAQLTTIAAQYAASLTLDELKRMKLGRLEDLAGGLPDGSGPPTRP